VTLTVSESDYGSVFVQKPGYITVTDPPTVGFSANVTAGLSPLAVQFNESINGSVQYYYWQFGDGGTSFEQNPVHVYTAAGRYTVSLYAIGSNGTQVKTIEDYIDITSPVTPTPTTPAPVNTTTVPTTNVPTSTLTPVPTNTTIVPTVTTVAPTVTVTGNPYNGPHTIPGTLQAEDYDLGGEGVAYHDTTAANEGGVYRHDDVDIEQLDTDGSPNVGWIRAGEWMAYTVNVSTAGTYTAGFRVASSHSGSTVQVYVDDGTTPVATVSVPNTGDWPAFRTVQVPVTLPAGQHRLRLSFPTDYVNINWITFA
jgi:PKD repeat protein